MFKEEVNNWLKEELKKQLVKKRPYLFWSIISKFFATNFFSWKWWCVVKTICKNLGLINCQKK
jgi:hypothetical protein